MQNDPSRENLKDIWQHQSPEEYKVSLQLIRLRAQELARKTRLQFFTVCTAALALIAFDVWNSKRVRCHSSERDSRSRLLGLYTC